MEDIISGRGVEEIRKITMTAQEKELVFRNVLSTPVEYREPVSYASKIYTIISIVPRVFRRLITTGK